MTFKKYLKEMAYPVNFSFEEFEKIKSYAGKLKYANERLQKLASGSSRVVYKVDGDKVLKIAKNEKGLAQNNVEADSYLQNYDITARVFESSRDGFYVEMEFAIKLKPTRFKAITGVDIRELDQYLRYKERESKGQKHYWSIEPDIKSRLDNNDFVQEIVNLSLEYDMPMGDFTRLSSFGEVIRNGKPAIVVIDFGLTNSIYNDFYKVA